MPSKPTRRPERGDIWVADLNPRLGTEPGKRRPVLIVQAQALLDADHPSTLVMPLTTRLIEDAEPLRIRIPRQGKLKEASDILIDQLRSIDNRRLVAGPVAKLGGAVMSKISTAVREVMDLK